MIFRGGRRSIEKEGGEEGLIRLDFGTFVVFASCAAR